MLTVALTGGIASGKSTVSAMLQRLGALVVDADQLVREAQQPGTKAYADIVARFGSGVVAADGSLDRAALGRLVFEDADARRDLEAITHPRVRELIAERLVEAEAGGASVAVVDIPLLFETDRAGQYSGVLLVYAAPAVQLQRLRERSGLTDAEARQRLAAQLPIDEKRARATWVIDNSGSLEATEVQVKRWWDELGSSAE
ncbi:MAG TPA: dephospho-CoA kinase [Candidatus Dormibacteraeota bacterium]|nr:dephospho-CoA kinase [Candidatus Dormibacteraeota bacterium]